MDLDNLPDSTPTGVATGNIGTVIDFDALPDNGTSQLKGLYRQNPVKPDDFARARKVSRATGLPLVTAQNMPAEAARLVEEPDWAALQRNAPATANAMLKSTDLFHLAKDDTENLSYMERFLNATWRAGKRGFISGLQGTDALDVNDAVGVLDTISKIESGQFKTDAEIARGSRYASLFAGAGRSPEALGAMKQRMQQQLSENALEYLQRAEKLRNKELLPTQGLQELNTAETFGDAMAAVARSPSVIPELVFQSLGTQAPAIPAMIASGFAGAGALASTVGVSSAFTEYVTAFSDVFNAMGINMADPEAARKAIASPEFQEAMRAKGAKASVIGLFDAATAGIAGKTLAPAKFMGKETSAAGRALTNIAAQTGVQGAGGGSGEAFGALAAGEDISPGAVLSEIIAEMPGGAVDTLLLAGRRASDNTVKVQDAMRDAQQLEQLLTTASQSKLLQRSPETFAEFLQSAADSTEGGLKEVHIDAKTLVDVLNQAGVAQGELLGRMPSLADQLQEAVEAGGDVTIPVGEFVSNIANTGLEASLLPHLRTSEDALSLVEAQEAAKEAQDFFTQSAETVIKEAADAEEARASADKVRQTFVDQLAATGRFTADVNDNYANLMRSFYTVLGNRLGVNAETAYAQYPYQVVAASQQLQENNTLSSGTPPGVGLEKRIEQDYAGAVAEYASLPDTDGGRLLNVDAARELSPEYRADRARSADVHEASSAFIKRVYADKLSKPTPQGKAPYVLFTAGGTGAGKSTGLSLMGDAGATAEIVYDTNMNGFESSDKKIKQALDAGREVRILYVYRDPVEALTAGSLPRAMQMGRTVPLREHARTHVGARETMQRLAEKYKDDPRVQITAVDNSQGKGRAKVVALANVPEVSDNALEVKLNEAAKAELEAGRVSEAVYRGTVGAQDPNGQRAGQGVRGESEQADQAVGGTLAQQNRGTFNPASMTTTLLETADLTTFLHETGHFFLEVMADVAVRVDAPADTRQDMDTVLQWFGVESIEKWRGMSLDEQRPYHEKFAESFEQYLFEGKAPNAEMRSTFRRFREFMVSVYKTLEQFLRSHDTKLSDEVRAVFDRLLASEAEIKEAERQTGMLPDFEATNEALERLQSRSLRDLKWTVNARSRILKQLQKDVDAKRTAVAAEVKTEVRAMPEYAAQRLLKFGELEGEKVEGGKLSTSALREMYGDGPAAPWRYLATNMLTKEDSNALHPNMVAEIFGFADGDKLVRAIIAAQPEDAMIEGLTDRRLIERYGDLATDKGVERAANEAIHNEVRARFVASELRAMREGMNVRERTPGGGSVNVLIQAAKDFAQNLIARRRVRDLRPGSHTAAEAKAARRAEQLQATGDTAGAIAAKREQLLSHYAAKYALEAQAEVDTKIDYLKKFDKDSVRAKLPPEYQEQIDAILERFDLRKGQSLKAIDKRVSLLAWVQAQQDQGYVTEVSDKLLDEANRKSYKDMTMEEFRGVVDTVRNIEHLGRLKDTLLTARDKRAFKVVEDDLYAEVQDNASKTLPEQRISDRGVLVKASSLFRSAMAIHRKFGSMARQLGGFANDTSQWWERVVRTMNERGDYEAGRLDKANAALMEMLKPVLAAGDSMTQRVAVPGRPDKTFSREERIGLLLNMGNEINTERVLTGEAISRAQLDATVGTLSKIDVAYANAVWKFVDDFWPEISAKQKRLTGIEPEKVEAQPFTLVLSDGSTATLRGGYFPIAYDPLLSGRSNADINAQVAKQLERGIYVRNQTRRGHIEQRVASTGRPLRYDFANVIAQHVQQVVHDLAWHEYLIDANRLLRPDGKLAQAITAHYGREMLVEMQDTLRDIAIGNQRAERGAQFFNHLRYGTTISTLALNVFNALQNLTGITNSMSRIGTKWVIKGALHWAGDTVSFESGVAKMRAKSEFMRLREKQLTRDINDIRSKIDGKSGALGVAFFYLQAKLQLVVDTPTWWGAYEKAMSQEHMDEKTAIALADQAVRDAQGSGQPHEQAGIMRGSAGMKALTTFYGYFNTVFNLTAEAYHRADFRKPLDAVLFASDIVLLYAIPALLTSLFRGWIADDDEDKLKKRIIADLISYAMGVMVGLREASVGVQAAAGVYEGVGYTGPAALRLFSDLYRLGVQANQGELDAAFWKALNSVGGIAFHYPAGQINRTVEGAKAYSEGETKNPAAVLFGPPLK